MGDCSFEGVPQVLTELKCNDGKLQSVSSQCKTVVSSDENMRVKGMCKLERDRAINLSDV